MADEGISYEMLQDLLRSERRSNKLMPVATRFWRDVRTFLDELMATFREEQQKDPFSRRVMLLTDEVKHARRAVESVWALRERKMALFALAQVKDGGGKRPEHLTPAEERVYDGVLEALRRGRAAVLEGHATPEQVGTLPDAHEVPAGEGAKRGDAQPPVQARAGEAQGPRAEPEASPTTPEAARPADDAEPAAEPGKEGPAGGTPATVPSDTPDDDMVTIRALSDIPAFVGPDMQTYLLQEGDVATVPQAIAGLLERRKKAAVIEA